MGKSRSALIKAGRSAFYPGGNAKDYLPFLPWSALSDMRNEWFVEGWEMARKEHERDEQQRQEQEAVCPCCGQEIPA